MKYGICTFYYRNRNYGANLQAYALQKVVESFGVQAEMISYTNRTRLFRLLGDLKQKVGKKSAISDQIFSRNTLIDQFNFAIPHSKLYYSNTIEKANDQYDGFIVGSDQVWNPDWINKCMSLNFSFPGKRTIAYAVSIGKTTLNDLQKENLRIAVGNTDFISVREKESIRALQDITEKEIEFVLDPTLLLEQKQWDEICSERQIKEPYIFCYFLGNNENLRKIAKQYGEIRKLKLVTLPYLNGLYRAVDDGFGDYQLYDVSPCDFISLIKNASFMMTDSFHGAVFSHLYKTPFIVSGGGKDEMGCRMLSLTELFGTEDRYIKEHNDITVEKLLSVEKKDMKLDNLKYKSMRQKSLDFLEMALKND